MKIFTSAQLRELDRYTTEHERTTSLDLMERSARAIAHALTAIWPPTTPVVVFAGPGNNGGDALAVARLLCEQSYKVKTYLFNIHNKLSEECAVNRRRLLEGKHAQTLVEVTVNFDPPQLTAETLVVDGLFGTGLNKPLSGGFASLVKYINQSPSRVASIDIPSGLMAEDNTYNIRANIVRAHLTLTIQQKKLCMLLADNQPYLGQIRVLDIQLSQEYVKKTDSQYRVTEAADLKPLLRRRHEFAHKGDMGHALLVAGKYGMAGAAILATRACFRTGVGKVTVHTPRKNNDILQTSVPEAILHLDREDQFFSEPVGTDGFDALAIGPGLGTAEPTSIAMIAQLRRATCPCIIDADALNILSNHRAWMQQLPKEIIMTPHDVEFDRLIGNTCNGSYDRLSKVRDMAERINAYIILKGRYSALCLPDGHVYFNPTGNPGMATAGSGDVLTGIITGLVARGYQQREACLIGMYLHGLAGDMAASDIGQESLIASDIVRYLPKAIRKLQE